jgi:hypothetical protein
MWKGSEAWSCCGCGLIDEDWELPMLGRENVCSTPEEMIAHLKKHISVGDKVPQCAFDRLEVEKLKRHASEESFVQKLVEGMEELARGHCWRCDPDDYETKRLIMEPCDQQLWWFCPDCQTYYREVDENELD